MLAGWGSLNRLAERVGAEVFAKSTIGNGVTLGSTGVSCEVRGETLVRVLVLLVLVGLRVGVAWRYGVLLQIGRTLVGELGRRELRVLAIAVVMVGIEPLLVVEVGRGWIVLLGRVGYIERAVTCRLEGIRCPLVGEWVRLRRFWRVVLFGKRVAVGIGILDDGTCVYC